VKRLLLSLLPPLIQLLWIQRERRGQLRPSPLVLQSSR
jgi:hypothetical protein